MRSEKVKRQEVFDNIIKDLKNHLKINDFSSIHTDFEKITEELKASGDILFGPGSNSTLPIIIVRTFAHIDKAINDVTNEQKKKLSKNSSQALTKLKQKFKKYLLTTGPESDNFDMQLTKFKENPVWSEDERKAAKKLETEGKKKIQSKPA